MAVRGRLGGATTAVETGHATDTRHPELGQRLYAASGAFSADASEDDYHAHRLALAVPEGGRDYAYGDAFPHEALMDQLGGVDFRKGCYVGQEVVSRMQHRGTARTRLLVAQYPEGAPDKGTEVRACQKVLGTTAGSANGRGLAMLRLDRLADALAAGEPAGRRPAARRGPARLCDLRAPRRRGRRRAEHGHGADRGLILHPDGCPRCWWAGSTRSTSPITTPNGACRSSIPAPSLREADPRRVPAGLSWITILKRREGFREAFHGFSSRRSSPATRRTTSPG